jgi:hypothetical protein
VVTEVDGARTGELDGRRQLRRIHALLAVQSLLVVAVSVNRLSSLTLGYVSSNEFLRWVDLINMIVLPLISVVAIHLLRQVVRYDTPQRARAADVGLGVVFVAGVYLFAAGYGAHEVTNYLHGRFCDPVAGRMCEIIAANDDGFSHVVFFVGFVLINLSVMLLPLLFPARRLAYGWDVAALAGNAAVFSLGIFANLAFEQIGLDLYVVAIVGLIALGLWWRRWREPLLIYYVLTYWLALLATATYKLMA